MTQTQQPDSRTLWCARNLDPGILTVSSAALTWKPRIFHGKSITIERASVTEVRIEKGYFWPDCLRVQYKGKSDAYKQHMYFRPGTRTFVLLFSFFEFPVGVFMKRSSMAAEVYEQIKNWPTNPPE